MKDIEKIINYWITASNQDWKIVKNLFNSKNYSYSLFFLHLTLEKLLKALYVKYLKENPPKTHNLLYLLEKTGEELDFELKNKLIEINTFQIEARYPDEQFSFYKKSTKIFTENYINEGRKIIKWLKKKLEI